MPTINISYEDGLTMVKSKAKRVRLCVINEEKTATSQNVIGELTGDSKPDEIVLVGGHYDTVPEVPGASDNAAGTAIAVELARVFREKGSKRTMRFIAWGCEEVGLLGSAYDAVRLKNESDDLKKKHSEQDITTELEKIRLVANIDVQGGVIGSNFESALGPPELSASVKLLAKELGVAFSTSGGPGTTDGVYSSDNASYSSVGIPSVSFIRGGGGGGHSVEDSIEWLSSDALGLQGRFIERFLTRYVAEAATFPFERVIPPEARQAIERYYKNRMEKPPGSD
jgi:Zn-dependent M28 family amino/carboxypeptidase